MRGYQLVLGRYLDSTAPLHDRKHRKYEDSEEELIQAFKCLVENHLT